MERRAAAGGGAVAEVIEDWARERPELDTAPLEVLARLHRSFLRYSTRLTASIERHGLSVAGFDVLTALRRSGQPYRLTAGQLADSGLVSSAGVTLRIDRLEKDGLIVRERDAADRRVVYSRLTDEGLARVDEVFAEHLDNERRMLGGMSPAECRQLARLLGKLEHSILAADEDLSD
ncbi:MarR family winged helix-turn-helix transcriptional regulator [Streptomyces sp. WZ-12]|uniref:MarR family winged helix-turn-helix transcriptional regulator n=1 Tax=Streptomyces sp. WZ-12 TaxID=3030210 RepID=UPI0023810154|nr:MarR family transcriptional regulator [Streptomyces sp. WZ-12]